MSFQLERDPTRISFPLSQGALNRHDRIGETICGHNGGSAGYRSAILSARLASLNAANGNTVAINKEGTNYDRLYSIIVDALNSLFNMNCLDDLATPLLASFESLLNEHYVSPNDSRLRALTPGIKPFITPLPFAEAFRIYNEKYRITKRLFIPPTFHEIRHIMNIAQVMAICHNLQLVTFDGDETLYPDGKNFDDINTAQYITTLLENGCAVAVVTAAGYGYQTKKYETRLYGLLQYFQSKSLSSAVTSRFFLFGGESNYLMCCGSDYHLHPVPEPKWRPHVSPRMKQFFDNTDSSGGEGPEIRRLLDTAAEALEVAIQQLSLRAVVVRKARAVGLVPGGLQAHSRKPTGSGTRTIKPEILEEVVFRIRQAIHRADPPLTIPYCAFNGGHDVWVDVGNKAEALLVLQSFLRIPRHGCLHIGDQFSISGNDAAARDVAATLWICNPSETKAVLRSLLRQMTIPQPCIQKFPHSANSMVLPDDTTAASSELSRVLHSESDDSSEQPTVQSSVH